MKVLLYDVETSPSIGAYFDPYKERNILWTEQEWHMLSFAYKWHGDNKTHVKALPDYPRYTKDPHDDLDLIKDLHSLFEEANIIIGHNGDKFDIRKSNARFIYHKLPPPPPYKTVDTLKVARKHFKFESNHLNDLGEHLGVGKKVDTGGIQLWRDCMNGDTKAWNLMKKYNRQDVILLEQVYEKLKPWIINHPVINPNTREGQCPHCGSHNHKPRGKAYNKKSFAQRYRCLDCTKSWSGNLQKYEQT